MKERTDLYLDFVDSFGKKFSIQVPNPKDEISPEELKSAMEIIKEKNIFERTIVALDGARIVTRAVEEIEME